MKTPRPLPEELQDRPFTVVEAARAGVSNKRLRHRALHRLGKGIRSGTATAELPLSIRVRPFIEVNERCAASHLTAAEMLVLPRRQQKGTPDMFHVIRPEGSAHLTTSGAHLAGHGGNALGGRACGHGGQLCARAEGGVRGHGHAALQFWPISSE